MCAHVRLWNSWIETETTCNLHLVRSAGLHVFNYFPQPRSVKQFIENYESVGNILLVFQAVVLLDCTIIPCLHSTTERWRFPEQNLCLDCCSSADSSVQRNNQTFACLVKLFPFGLHNDSSFLIDSDRVLKSSSWKLQWNTSGSFFFSPYWEWILWTSP